MLTDYLKQKQARECFGQSKPLEEKKPVPIAKKSDKMKSELKKYIPAAKEFLSLPENEYCKIQLPGCLQIAVCIHHAAGRTGHKLHDQSDWVPSCGPCNLACETKDLEAREKGVKKSKFKI